MIVLITRPKAQAGGFARALRAAGFEPVFFPVIEIQPIENNLPLQQALLDLAAYDWLVFTSVNGVAAFWQAISALGLAGLPEHIRLAAIGPKTAAALQAQGVQLAFVPAEYVAEAILPGLGDLRGRRVLLPRAEVARQTLPQAIRQAGSIVDDIPVYRTLPAAPDPAGLHALRTGVQVVTLTSPSTVYNFIALVRAAGLDPLALPGDPLYACIGPITAQAALLEGLSNRIVAEAYTTEGLIAALTTRETRQR